MSKFGWATGPQEWPGFKQPLQERRKNVGFPEESAFALPRIGKAAGPPALSAVSAGRLENGGLAGAPRVSQLARWALPCLWWGKALPQLVFVLTGVGGLVLCVLGCPLPTCTSRYVIFHRRNPAQKGRTCCLHLQTSPSAGLHLAYRI